MTRRAFFALVPGLGSVVPYTGTQFEVSGHFDHAGADNHLAYYSLGQSLSLTLDPAKLPAMVAQCDKLVGKQARIVLEEA